MSTSVRYAITGTAAIATIVAGLWPFLEPAGRSGILAAAAVALPVQIIAFWALNRFRSELKGFLAAWIGGTLVRMAVIATVAVVVIRSGTEGAVPMLLALAGFFFGLLLLEPVYFRIGPSETVEA
jgi:hypothetical protein